MILKYELSYMVIERRINSQLITHFDALLTSVRDEQFAFLEIEQKILLDKGVYLFDTPGMLLPKIRLPEAGINLAASGAVGRNAFEEEVVALDLLGYLRRHYPQALKTRYQLEPDASLLDGEVLAMIGKRRGAVLSGGRINTQKAAEILLYDLRQGQLGRITLETPEEFDEWTAAAEAAEAAKLAEKENMSDVIAGVAIGATVGWLMHERESPFVLSVMPQGVQLGLSKRW